jgi:hypothetical protein
MKAVHFSALGEYRSYWDFYRGFGLSISIYAAVFAIVLWQLGGQAKADPVAARPMILVMLLAYLGLGLLCWKYFFAPPLVFAGAVALCLGAALALSLSADSSAR